MCSFCMVLEKVVTLLLNKRIRKCKEYQNWKKKKTKKKNKQKQQQQQQQQKTKNKIYSSKI